MAAITETYRPPSPPSGPHQDHSSKRDKTFIPIRLTFQKAMLRLQNDVADLPLPDGIDPIQINPCSGISRAEVVRFSSDLREMLIRDARKAKRCFEYFTSIINSYSKHLNPFTTCECVSKTLNQMLIEQQNIKEASQRIDSNKMATKGRDTIRQASIKLASLQTKKGRKERLLQFRKQMIPYEYTLVGPLYRDALFKFIKDYIPLEERTLFDIELNFAVAEHYLACGMDQWAAYQRRKLVRLGQLHPEYKETIDKLLAALDQSITQRIARATKNAEDAMALNSLDSVQENIQILRTLADRYEDQRERIQKLLAALEPILTRLVESEAQNIFKHAQIAISCKNLDAAQGHIKILKTFAVQYPDHQETIQKLLTALQPGLQTLDG